MTSEIRDWTRGEPALVVTRCTRCGNHWYLPHTHCPVCGSRDAVSRVAAGGGLCVAVTRVHVTARDEDEPPSLALVELDEGPLVLGRVHDPDLAPGDRARAEFRFDGYDDVLVPSFTREG